MEVCRTLTPDLRLRHLKFFLLVPSLFFVTLLYRKAETDTTIQMMPDAHQRFWLSPGILGGLIHWRYKEDEEPAAPTPLQVLGPDCDALFAGDQLEIQVTQEMVYKESWRSASNSNLKLSLKNCSPFLNWNVETRQPYISSEKSKPLAYIIALGHNFEQFGKLLHAIYMPQNQYCVYIDTNAKSFDAIESSLQYLASCFSNVFMPSTGHFTVSRLPLRTFATGNLHWQLSCLRILVSERNTRWSHVIHITDQYFPLQSNREIVASLSNLANLNDIPGAYILATDSSQRPVFKHTAALRGDIENTKQRILIPKMLENTTLYEGEDHFIISKAFSNYAIRNIFSQTLAAWLQNATKNPHSIFWLTLHRSSVRQKHQRGSRSPSIVAATKWARLDLKHSSCVEQPEELCTFGVADLHWLSKQRRLFAGHFDLEFDHLALQCLDERLTKTFKLQHFSPNISLLVKRGFSEKGG